MDEEAIAHFFSVRNKDDKQQMVSAYENNK